MAIIYKTTDILNDKIYIGQSIFNNEEYYGSGKWLKRAIIKYGKDNFKKEIVEECDISELNEKEIYWINYYKSNEIGYNISRGGQVGWMNGLKHTDETKNKLSEMNKGHKNHFYGKHHTEETKKKISESLKKSEKFQKSIKNEEKLKKMKLSATGRNHSDETKKKISEKNKGKKRTQEMKNKMSEIQKELKPFLGKKHTEEWKQMMSKLHKGKIVSLETKEKMRNNNIGKKLTNETKQKISKKLEKEIYEVINNIIVKKWQSATEASKEINLSVRKIGYFCRKKDSSNKYNLIYKENYDKND